MECDLWTVKCGVWLLMCNVFKYGMKRVECKVRKKCGV